MLELVPKGYKCEIRISFERAQSYMWLTAAGSAHYNGQFFVISLNIV
jgi:hypothetical protein